MNRVPFIRMSPVFALGAIALLFLVPAGLLPAASPEALSAFAPPRHCAPPGKEHAVTNRAFTGIPSVAVAPQGRLWATWYAGVTPGEDLNNYAVLATSDDGGATWREVLVVDPDAGGPLRAFDPELWLAPDGRLFFFWAQMDRTRRDTEHGVWCIETPTPDAAEPEWSPPRRIHDGVMMCKPIVLSSGEWALPISRWGMEESAEIVVSLDAGKTFTRRGACSVPEDVREFDEHMLVERQDGSLWMLVRTRYGIGESVSTDRGMTWPKLAPSSILHTRSRFFIHRLASGNLLLVKHGSLDQPSGRSLLTAYVSKDDGTTWEGGLLLDERSGISYPDGHQGRDGLIRVVYDHDRRGDREILMATFREDDVMAGPPASGEALLRQLVSKGSGGVEQPKRATRAASRKRVSSEAAPTGLSPR